MQVAEDFPQRLRFMAMEARAESTRTAVKPAIADVLREGIRQGLLAPGQPLIQASIADAMGVSRIPVREALHALASEGNFAFHQDLNRLSGMPHFADVAARVLTMIEPYSRVAVTVLDAQGEAQAEHRAMVDAIAAGDGDALAALLRHHSDRARQALLEYSLAQRRDLDEREVTSEAARSLAERLGG